MFCGTLENPGKPCGGASQRLQGKGTRPRHPHQISTAPLCLFYTSGFPVKVQLMKRVSLQKKKKLNHKGYLHFTHHLIVYNNAIKKTEAEGAYSQTPQPIL